MNSTVTFNFEPDSARLIRAIETPDDVGAVIRVHFEIDRALEHIVNVMIPTPSLLRHQYMDSRIRFLLALGLPEVRIAPAKVINEIRNKFAHREKENFENSDIAKLSGSVTALIGKEVPTHFALIHKRADSQREWQYGDMTLKEKFCVLGYIALSGVATIENDFPKLSFAQASRTDLA